MLVPYKKPIPFERLIRRIESIRGFNECLEVIVNGIAETEQGGNLSGNLSFPQAEIKKELESFEGMIRTWYNEPKVVNDNN